MLLLQVALHNTEHDCWCIINGDVYDITEFLPDHPGGKTAPVLLSGAQLKPHNLSALQQYTHLLRVGRR